MKQTIGFILAYVALCAWVPARADTLKLYSGRVYEGSVIVENERRVLFRSEGRIITAERRNIESLERTAPPIRDNGKSSTVEPLTSLFTVSVYVHQGPLEDLVLRVGSGGITKKEYVTYLKRRARRQRKEWTELSKDEKRQALDAAIEDELLFQAALAAGVHNQPSMRRQISDRYRAMETTDKVGLEDISEEDILAFYDANQDLFMEPASLRLKYRQFASGTQGHIIREALEKAKADPPNAGGWRDMGWITTERDLSMLSKREIEGLFELSTNTVSEPLTDLYGTTYFFWSPERKAAAPRSFDNVKRDIAERLLEDRQQELNYQFEEKLEAERGTLDAEEHVFRSALYSGVQRDWRVRQQIIQAYLQSKNTAKEELLPSLRKRYKVGLPD